jgi:hypothetical protein
MSRVTCVELLNRADLALRKGDSIMLARVARHLGSRIGDPLAGRCEALALSCGNDQKPSRAWRLLRREIVDRAATAGS